MIVKGTKQLGKISRRSIAVNKTLPGRKRFTPLVIQPAPTDPYGANVSLLLHTDGAEDSTVFTDSSLNNFTVTPNGNARVKTAVKKFGSGAAYFDGSGDLLTIPDSSEFQFGAGDFTVEGWVNLGQEPSFSCFVTKEIANVAVGSNTNSFEISFWGSPSRIRVTLAATNSFSTSQGWMDSYFNLPSGTFAPGTWHHVAIVRSSVNVLVFWDGLLIGTYNYGNFPIFPATGVPLAIGSRFLNNLNENDGFFNGYIDDLRITKGIARYTSNFTPPTAAFPNPSSSSIPTSGLSLWLKADEGVTQDESGNVTLWTDQSGNGKNATTVNGGANSPIYVSSAINTKPAIRFNNVTQSGNSYMRILNPIFNLKNSSCFVVVKQNSTGSTTFGRMLSFLPASGDDYNTNNGLAFLFANTFSRLQVESNGNSVIINSALANSFAICSYIIDSSGNINLYYNNDLSATGSNINMASQNDGDFYIAQGSQLAGAASALDGEIAEIIIYNRAITTQERIVIENYLNEKYNIIGSSSSSSSSSSSNPPITLTTNLKAYWAFNSLNDSHSSYTLTNNNNVGFEPGPAGYHAVFDGVYDGENDNTSGNYLSSDVFNLEGSSFISFSTWVYFNDVSVNQSIFGQFTGFGPGGAWWVGMLEENNQSKFIFIVNGTELRSTTLVQANTWYHLAGTYDGTSIKIYLNGELNNSISATLGNLQTFGRQFQIGWDNSSGDYLNGKLDEVRIWDRALASLEVQEVYDLNSNDFSPSSSSSSSSSSSGPVQQDLLVTAFETNPPSDSSGRNISLSLSNGAIINTTTYKNGSGAFDAVSGGVCRSSGLDIPDLSETDWAIECWVYRPTEYTTNRQAIVNLARNNTYTGFNLYYYDGDDPRGSIIVNDGLAADIGAGVIPPQTWTHIRVTSTNGIKTLYVNGVAIQTGAQNILSGPYKVNIGNISENWSGASFGSDIIIDDVKIYLNN